jgi:hypothetical protein
MYVNKDALRGASVRYQIALLTIIALGAIGIIVAMILAWPNI